MAGTDKSDDFHLKKFKRFVSPYLQQRMDSGKVSPQELEKYFPLSSRELQAMKKGPVASKGLIGVILFLEDVIVDAREIYSYSYSYFYQSIGRMAPTDAQINDVIGEQVTVINILFRHLNNTVLYRQSFQGFNVQSRLGVFRHQQRARVINAAEPVR